MTAFDTKSPSDGTVLRGRFWAADIPKAVMSLVIFFTGILWAAALS